MCYLGWAVRCWGKSQGAVVSGTPTFSRALCEKTSPQYRPGLQRWFGEALSWRPSSMAPEIELKLQVGITQPLSASADLLRSSPYGPFHLHPAHQSLAIPIYDSPLTPLGLHTCFPSTGLPFPDFPHLVTHSSFKTPSGVSFFLETGGPLPPDHLFKPLTLIMILDLPPASQELLPMHH